MNLRNLNTKVGSARCGKIQCCLVVTDPAIHSLLDRCCSSFNFETHLVEWDVPTPRYLFEAERDAGVRTAGLLARQASDRLEAIMRAIGAGVRRYAKGDRFAIPMAAHIVVASKR